MQQRGAFFALDDRAGAVGGGDEVAGQRAAGVPLGVVDRVGEQAQRRVFERGVGHGVGGDDDPGRHGQGRGVGHGGPDRDEFGGPGDVAGPVDGGVMVVGVLAGRAFAILQRGGLRQVGCARLLALAGSGPVEKRKLNTVISIEAGCATACQDAEEAKKLRAGSGLAGMAGVSRKGDCSICRLKTLEASCPSPAPTFRFSKR
ncbi:hypothetical protein [Maliponia aquimaris]|uniref:hypothetical protein n=1 Tax=Maliponia aquimaris TaxID=1673631 RepID=UPI000B8AE5FD|nr:hypothetical protein [Maliponia aquimaris]